MTGHEWIARFAESLDVPVPPADQLDEILQLAGAAAHASERTAAPIACWIAAAAGLTPAVALARAEEVRADD